MATNFQLIPLERDNLETAAVCADKLLSLFCRSDGKRKQEKIVSNYVSKCSFTNGRDISAIKAHDHIQHSSTQNLAAYSAEGGETNRKKKGAAKAQLSKKNKHGQNEKQT